MGPKLICLKLSSYYGALKVSSGLKIRVVRAIQPLGPYQACNTQGTKLYPHTVSSNLLIPHFFCRAEISLSGSQVKEKYLWSVQPNPYFLPVTLGSGRNSPKQEH